MLTQASNSFRGIQQPPRCARGTATLCYQAANLISPRRHRAVARPGISKPQEASSQYLHSRSRTAQASTHTGSDTARTPEEVKQCIRQYFQDLGSSLEEQPQEVLSPLLSGLLKDGHKEAAAMVIDAFLVSTPKPTQEVQATLLSSHAVLEAAYDPQRALQTYSEIFQLGGGKAADYRVYGHILFKENNDAKAAAAALSHAAAICEPSEKFNILVDLAWCKEATGDGQGALKDLSEADTLGQLGAEALILLSELRARHGDAALDRAKLVVPLAGDSSRADALYRSRSRSAQASAHTGSDTARTPEELKQSIRQNCQDLGSSLEEQPQDVLYRLMINLLDDGHKEAAVMVINAILVSTPKLTQAEHAKFIRFRAEQEISYDPQRALQTFSEYFQLGGGKASDYLCYGRLLLYKLNNEEAALAALSHAAAICELSEKSDILVVHAFCKELTGDRQGALKDLSEADALGQLDARTPTVLAMFHERNGDFAAAISALDRAALIEPLRVSDTEQRAHCKLAVGDYSGAKTDLDAIILLGVNNSVTDKARGVANMQQFKTHLLVLDQVVAKPPDKVCSYEALVCRAAVRYKMGNIQDAAVDLATAHQLRPLSDFDQQPGASSTCSSL